MDIDDVAATSGEATAEAVVEACAQAGAEASTQACAEASADATATVDGEPDREDEIVVYGLSKWQTGKSLKERLEGHLAVKGIRRCRKQPTDTHAFVHFLTASAAEEARKLIDGHVWKGSELWTKQARAMDPERFVKRQRLERDAGEPEPSLKNVVDCVTPLHALPYEEQLLVKRKVLLGALRELPTKWKTTMKEMPKEAWAAWRVPFVDPKVTQAHEGAPCELAPVIPAPRTHGYRNKCEFSFGRDAEGRPCIGFLRGALRFGPPVVGPPDACPNVSDEMKAVQSAAPSVEAAEAEVEALLASLLSPPLFPPVNTTGAEALCELLRSLVGATKETVLLDVCCGTGTLGLSLASSVKRLIGIEMCAPAVEDARANAARNGITNALFIAKKAEEATLSVLENLSAAEKRSLVAIVDPPRAGLHTDVLKALRGCLPLTKILFVACHAPSFVANSVAAEVTAKVAAAPRALLALEHGI
ncbi:tRNA (uracil-5-)-methyltransferase-like a [Chrysochromulina tobinii]|uniref:tRNA (Uracil-5-)-methyltransferase-like a n=1 Tax=Chrysochromulina tobinii TaxID=1460289 RepID=A0A0M0JTR7_9EUKA|nr:tRNA (uracil-5-)-methyltransferase-like a [Chrysochromulina tobinii]|eukprot:KOO29742.1 tRNA (uracil-5-)-methyltransferase-like a [Chrysochromulina sp. CCMP291]